MINIEFDDIFHSVRMTISKPLKIMIIQRFYTYYLFLSRLKIGHVKRVVRHVRLFPLRNFADVSLFLVAAVHKTALQYIYSPANKCLKVIRNHPLFGIA